MDSTQAVISEMELSAKFEDGKPLTAEELVEFGSTFNTADSPETWAVSAATALISIGMSHENLTKEGIVVAAQMLCARLPDDLLGLATMNFAKHVEDALAEGNQ